MRSTSAAAIERTMGRRIGYSVGLMLKQLGAFVAVSALVLTGCDGPGTRPPFAFLRATGGSGPLSAVQTPEAINT